MERAYSITIIPLEKSVFAIIEWKDGETFGFNARSEEDARQSAECVARSKPKTN